MRLILVLVAVLLRVTSGQFVDGTDYKDLAPGCFGGSGSPCSSYIAAAATCNAKGDPAADACFCSAEFESDMLYCNNCVYVTVGGDSTAGEAIQRGPGQYKQLCAAATASSNSSSSSSSLPEPTSLVVAVTNSATAVAERPPSSFTSGILSVTTSTTAANGTVAPPTSSAVGKGAKMMAGRPLSVLGVLFASSSFALALAPLASPVTELAARFSSNPVLIHLFDDIPAGSNIDKILQTVRDALVEWRAAEVEAHKSKWRAMIMTPMPLGVTDSTGAPILEPNPSHDPNYVLPSSIRLSFKEVGLSVEGAIFVHLTRTSTISSLYSYLKRATIPMPPDLDHNDRATWAHPDSPSFPTFNLVQADSLDKGRDLFDSLQSSEELVGGDEGLKVAAEHSIDIAEVVLLEGLEGKWAEVARVPLGVSEQ